MTRDAEAFPAAIRTRVFAFFARGIGDDERAIEELDGIDDGAGASWTRERLHAARETYREEHGDLRLDPEARNLRNTDVRPSDDRLFWRVQQMLVDVEGLNDWMAELRVDLAESRRASEPVIHLSRLESLV